MTATTGATLGCRSIDELDVIAPGAFAAAVAPLFEGARGFLGRLAMARPFGSVEALFARAREIAHTMPLDEQLELIDAHPRLGAPPADGLGAVVRRAGLRRRTPTDGSEAAEAEARGRRVAAELDRLNAAYEARFGFRYCVFVAGRSRAALLPGMTAALEADRDAEIQRALDAVIDIAPARYATLTAAPAEDRRDRARREPLRQGGHPARPRRARPGRRPRPRPDRGDRPRGRLRGRPHRRRQRAGHRHRHDEEHGLRVRQGPPRRLRSRPTAAPSPSTSSRIPQVDGATVNIRAHHWAAIDVAGTPAPDAFVRGGEGTRVATVSASTRGGTIVEAGVEDLVVMKTTRSAFSGFPRDRYTTLPETDDRLMATKMTAIWRYGSPGPRRRRDVRRRPHDAARGLRRPRQPVGPDLDLDHGPGDPRASRGGRRGPHGPAQPPPLAGRPVAVRARRTTARSTRRRPSRTA